MGLEYSRLYPNVVAFSPIFFPLFGVRELGEFSTRLRNEGSARRKLAGWWQAVGQHLA
jgi:hypothetical protein